MGKGERRVRMGLGLCVTLVEAKIGRRLRMCTRSISHMSSRGSGSVSWKDLRSWLGLGLGLGRVRVRVRVGQG